MTDPNPVADRDDRRAPPRIVDADSDRRFRDLARARGLDPDARFVGGYVAWEWGHARHVFDDLVAPIAGQAALEFGCNMGGTAVVLAALGAEVTAVDPDPGLLALAQANAARHGLAHRVRFEHVVDTTRLPFADGAFTWVSCNSVLEYVPHAWLPGLLRELDRVLAPGGTLAVLGTSNRLWPREQHTGQWLVGYLPRACDAALPGLTVRRGVTAGSVRRVLGEGYEDLVATADGRVFVELKARMGTRGARLEAVRHGARALAWMGVSPGEVGATLTMLLRKRPG